jgi:hypothetical protein
MLEWFAFGSQVLLPQVCEYKKRKDKINSRFVFDIFILKVFIFIGTN